MIVATGAITVFPSFPDGKKVGRPVGLRFRPVGLRFRSQGLLFRQGLRSSVFVFGSSF